MRLVSFSYTKTTWNNSCRGTSSSQQLSIGPSQSNDVLCLLIIQMVCEVELKDTRYYRQQNCFGYVCWYNPAQSGHHHLSLFPWSRKREREEERCAGIFPRHFCDQ